MGVAARGTSKSAASRHLIARMTDQLREQLTRRLDQLDLLVLMLDGVEVARRTVVVALGILADGRKVVLGLWLGSTENAALSTALLQNLLERGLKVDGRTLGVIDGGRGIRKALTDVFGDLVVVPRCQVHNKRNVLDHLPQSPPRPCTLSRLGQRFGRAGAATTEAAAAVAGTQWRERRRGQSARRNGGNAHGLETGAAGAAARLPGHYQRDRESDRLGAAHQP